MAQAPAAVSIQIRQPTAMVISAPSTNIQSGGTMSNLRVALVGGLRADSAVTFQLSGFNGYCSPTSVFIAAGAAVSNSFSLTAVAGLAANSVVRVNAAASNASYMSPMFECRTYSLIPGLRVIGTDEDAATTDDAVSVVVPPGAIGAELNMDLTGVQVTPLGDDAAVSAALAEDATLVNPAQVGISGSGAMYVPGMSWSLNAVNGSMMVTEPLALDAPVRLNFSYAGAASLLTKEQIKRLQVYLYNVTTHEWVAATSTCAEEHMSNEVDEFTMTVACNTCHFTQFAVFVRPQTAGEFFSSIGPAGILASPSQSWWSLLRLSSAPATTCATASTSWCPPVTPTRRWRTPQCSLPRTASSRPPTPTL
jgi:hypothetical protein